jgi:hypothetical protein
MPDLFFPAVVTPNESTISHNAVSGEFKGINNLLRPNKVLTAQGFEPTPSWTQTSRGNLNPRAVLLAQDGFEHLAFKSASLGTSALIARLLDLNLFGY